LTSYCTTPQAQEPLRTVLAFVELFDDIPFELEEQGTQKCWLSLTILEEAFNIEAEASTVTL
jgi:hypothetical protein